MAVDASRRTAWVRHALSQPEMYPHPPPAVEVRETHISWVFLTDDRAYKLKKPLRLPFVDYGTPARRRKMCREEVRLNRRLAPDVYLGVRGVAQARDGFDLVADDDRRAVDFVVEMRRYDESATLAAKLERGELEREHVIAAARVLAEFHSRARRVPASNAIPLGVERRFEQNLHELLACAEQRSEVERGLALQRFAHAFVTRHATRLEVRARGGSIREGHGDLRAEHIVIGEGVEIVDCVEFDRELRELDVADDLAFLVLDLAAQGGERFGRTLIDAYREAGGDPGDDALIAFYATHRALIRAKVALVRAAQHPPVSAAHGHESAQARDLIVLAERFAWRARLPLVIAICGVPASGKSQLATALAEMSGLPHLSSDETRKRLAGLGPGARAPEEAYAPEWNALTYAELGRRARSAVGAHGGAIVDATFRHRSDRDTFAAAFGASAPTLFIQCEAPAAVLARRATHRERSPHRVSDADATVVMRERAAWMPLEEVPANEHICVRTDRAVPEIVADVVALLDGRLERLQSAAGQ